MKLFHIMKKTGYSGLVLAAALLLAPSFLPAAESIEDQMFNNLRNISGAFERSGNLEQAIRILVPHSRDPRVLDMLASMYAKADRHEEYLALVREVLGEGPGDSRLVALHIRALHGAGHGDSIPVVARSFLESAGPEPADYLILGDELDRLGLDVLALETYRGGRQAAGSDSLFSRQVARALVDLGRDREALRELLVFLGGKPSDMALARREIYRIAAGGDDSRELVFDVLGDALDDAGGQVREALLSIMVGLSLDTGDAEQAFESLETMLSGMDRERALRSMTVFVGRCLKLGEFETALRAYDYAGKHGIMEPELVGLNKAEVLESLGNYEQAESLLLELAAAADSADRFAVPAMKRLGDLYLERLDRPDEALAWYRRVEERDRQRGETLHEAKMKIVESFIRMEELDKAAGLCVELLDGAEAGSKKIEALKMLADIYFYRGEADSAATLYNSYARLRLDQREANDAIERVYLIRTDPGEDGMVSSRVGRALYLARLGRVQDAAQVFSETLREVPDSVYRVQVYYQMGRMYEQAGEFSLALGVYEEIAGSYPGHHLAPLSEVRMGMILLERIGDEEAAREHLERVVYDYPPGVATPLARRMLRSLDEERPRP